MHFGAMLVMDLIRENYGSSIKGDDDLGPARAPYFNQPSVSGI
jgi:hypothetical protein